MADTAKLDIEPLLVTMRNLLLRYGVIPTEQAMTPLEVEHLAGGDPFARGVLSTLAHLVAELRKTAEGRQALLDFFFEPVLQDVERPRGGGRND